MPEFIPKHMQSTSNRKTGVYSDYAQDAQFYQKRGNAKQFDNQKYKIDQHVYPDDLYSSSGQYGGNYAIFYINVSQDSKLIKNDPDLTVDDDTPRDRGEAIGTVNRGTSGEALAIAGAAEGVGLGAIGSTALGGGFLGTATVAGAAAVGAYAVGSVAGDFKASQKRLKTAIALHMPNNMTIRYGVNYEEKETMMAQLLGVAGDAAFSFVKSIKDKGMDDVKELAKNATPGIAAVALGKVPGSELAQKLTGLAPNPKKEQIFRNVDVRQFQIDYQFFPRDKKEADNVKNIIKQFKLHMHPEYKDSNAFLYIYPSEFDIFYYQGGSENLNVHRHTSCVLTEMSVNYTPQGRFNSFEDGTPTQINMFLTFRELVPLTKERIEDGF